MMYLTEDTFTDEYGVVHPKGERIPVELITNPLAIINRTIPMAMFETSITFILDKVSRAMRKLPFDEARDLMFDVLDTLNPTFAKEYKEDVYDYLSERDKRIAIEDAAKGEISIRWDAFDDSNSWRDNILKCYEKFPDILKPYHIFRPKKEWGRDVFVGEGHIGLQYMYMLSNRVNVVIPFDRLDRSTIHLFQNVATIRRLGNRITRQRQFDLGNMNYRTS